MGEDREDINQLTKDDLVLLMESYRNMIVMHQTILDQSNKTIDKIDNVAKIQDDLFTKTGSIFGSLNNVEKTINDNTSKTKEGSNKVETLTIALNNHEKKSIEDHGKITSKIYVGWIGMVTIILGLIGLAIAITDLLRHTP